MRVKRATAAPAAPAAPAEYPEGYFTELVRRHNWPPQWQPKAGDRLPHLSAQRAEAARQGRIASVQEGKGWGSGTIDLPGTRGNLAPKWMGSKS